MYLKVKIKRQGSFSFNIPSVSKMKESTVFSERRTNL